MNEDINLSDFHKELTKELIIYVNASKLNPEYIRICIFKIKTIYNEAQTDFNYLKNRRLPEGVGRCKLAGIYMWRLGRGNFLSLDKDYDCQIDKKLLHMNFIISLAFVIKHILKIDDATSLFKKYGQEFKELKYQLEHRHTNQELIGLFFKVICKNLEENCCEIEKPTE